MRTSVREVFAVAAAAYDCGNPLLLVERPETQALLPPLGGLDVLDVGAGRGHYACFARACGARRAVALDLVAEMLAGTAVPALVADAARLPFPERSFDVAIAALVVSYLPSREPALRELGRVLRPGGRLVLSDLHAEASRRGWRRSFEAPEGRRLTLAAPPPTVEALEAELTRAGFAVEARREALVDERLEAAFRDAGRDDYAELRGAPLLTAMRARKEAGR